MKVLILIDKTGSMTHFLESLVPVLQELQGFLALFFRDVEFSICFYSDFAFRRIPIVPVVVHCPFSRDPETLAAFVQQHKTPQQNDDNDEAQLSAAMYLTEHSLLDPETLVIHFTDAFPHLPNTVLMEHNSRREFDFFTTKGWTWDLATVAEQVRATNCLFVTFIDSQCHSTNPRGYDKVYTPFGLVKPCPKAKILSTVTSAVQELMLAPASFLSIRFSDIRKNVLSDPIFFTHCVNFFNDQLNRRNIAGALDIFGNRITAELYRSVVLRRDSDLVLLLKNRLSQLGSSFEGTELRLAMDASFNRLEIFDEKFFSSVPFPPNGHSNEPLPTWPCYGPSGVEQIAFPPKNLQSLFSSFEKANVAHFRWFINGLQDISAPGVSFPSEAPDGVQPSALALVPRDVPDALFFSMLTHLIVPGYLANARQTAIVALLALGANYSIRTRARNYLGTVVGKWLDFGVDSSGKPKFPENNAPDLVRFLLQEKHRGFLTPEEHKVLTASANARHFIGLPKMLSVTLSTKPRLLELPVETFRCSACNLARPEAIRIIGTTMCGFCEPGAVCQELTEVGHTAKHVTCSHCRGIYALVRPDIFLEQKYSAKCYYCRRPPSPANKPPPLVECPCCLNMWIVPNPGAPLNQCALCRANKLEFSSALVSLNLFLKSNSLGAALALRETRIVPIPTLLAAPAWEQEIATVHNRSLRLPNGDAIFAKFDLLRYLQYQPKDVVECALCCDEVDPVSGTLAICGAASLCPGVICTACVYRLWDLAQPGHLVELSAICCPFCRRDICQKSFPNHPIRRLIVPSASHQLSLQNTMAWCVSCNVLKVLAPRVCGAPAATIADFVCQECRPPTLPGTNEDRVFPCPRCSSEVCKAISTGGVVNPGCNHVSCEACASRGIATHLCAFPGCFRDFDQAGDCYDHMTEVHGGYYDVIV